MTRVGSELLERGERPRMQETGPTGLGALRVGVVYWYPDDGIGSLILSLVEQAGGQGTSLPYDGDLPDDIDVVVVHGPFASLVPLANQLLMRPVSCRPLLALWMTEQFSSPALPEWLHRPLGEVRSSAERLLLRHKHWSEDGIATPCSWLSSRALRLRYYGDLLWLRRQGVLSVLAVGSQWVAGYLRARGFDPVVAYLGSHPAWWAHLDLKRDIPVLWLGKTVSRRRKRGLARLRKELALRGVEVMMVDGEENPYAFGLERTVLLNRAKVVVNVLRTEWDNHSLRFFLAAPNRALIVSEPTYPHIPFEPGVHFVEASLDEMADTICHYLSHEQQASLIVERAYELATSEITMERAVRHILKRVLAVQQSTRGDPTRAGVTGARQL